jgi:hypothetical protein
MSYSRIYHFRRLRKRNSDYWSLHVCPYSVCPHGETLHPPDESRKIIICWIFLKFVVTFRFYLKLEKNRTSSKICSVNFTTINIPAASTIFFYPCLKCDKYFSMKSRQGWCVFCTFCSNWWLKWYRVAKLVGDNQRICICENCFPHLEVSRYAGSEKWCPRFWIKHNTLTCVDANNRNTWSQISDSFPFQKNKIFINP